MTVGPVRPVLSWSCESFSAIEMRGANMTCREERDGSERRSRAARAAHACCIRPPLRCQPGTPQARHRRSRDRVGAAAWAAGPAGGTAQRGVSWYGRVQARRESLSTAPGLLPPSLCRTLNPAAPTAQHCSITSSARASQNVGGFAVFLSISAE